ncbi:hypothetical protein [Lacticaseibacillus suihuaensis]
MAASPAIATQDLDLVENDKQAVIAATKRDITRYLAELAQN